MGLLKAAGVESKAGIEGTIETLETLAKMDRQPQRARAGGLVRRADAHLPGRGATRRLGRSAAVGLVDAGLDAGVRVDRDFMFTHLARLRDSASPRELARVAAFAQALKPEGRHLAS